MDLIKRRNEDGYTLVETLVAMSIFVSVLIPLLAVIGNATLISDTSLQRAAMRIAQTELITALHASVETHEKTTVNGFIAEIEVKASGRLIEGMVTVTAKGQERILARVHRSVLVD